MQRSVRIGCRGSGTANFGLEGVARSGASPAGYGGLPESLGSSKNDFISGIKSAVRMPANGHISASRRGHGGEDLCGVLNDVCIYAATFLFLQKFPEWLSAARKVVRWPADLRALRRTFINGERIQEMYLQ